MNKENLKNDIKLWIALQIIVPSFILIFVWFYSAIYCQLSHPFYKTFSGADLILAGALMTIGIFIEAQSEALSSAYPNRQNPDTLYLLIIGILLLIVYGFLKASSFNFSYPALSKDAPELPIIMNSAISILSFFCAVAYSVYFKLNTINLNLPK